MSTSAAWYDLSHRVAPDLPRAPTFPAPTVRKLMTQPQDPINVTEITMCCHVGTHVDAPCHFFEGGKSVDEIAPERLCGPGVVIGVTTADLGIIDVPDLAAADVRKDDIVFVHSGFSAYVGSERYERHPSFSIDAADWLAEREVKLLGVDFGTPDTAIVARTTGFDWPVHRRLLSAGVMIVEHLCGMADLVGQRVDAACLPIAVKGGDGAPARVVARPLR